MSDEPALAETIDAGRCVVAAEVALAVREDFARTLVDIVHRRLMIGLSADQGTSAYAAIQRLAAAELKWDSEQAARELEFLHAYNLRLRTF
jgi:glycerol-3-phosphate dehydrogenase